MKSSELQRAFNRRNFIKGLALSFGGTFLSAPILSAFPQGWGAGLRENQKKLGIALVGLGQYSTNQLAPALKETNNCYLAGIVTGTPSKAEAWQEEYDIPEANIYNYENFDEIASNDAIDAVYVVLPNALHAEYTIRAARAGKHVICEKPMATSVADAERMLQACRDKGVGLSIGYRLHFEPFNKRVMELGQEEVFGKVKNMEAADSSDMTDGNLDLWRLDKELAGGGPLMDLGIYCAQGAIYSMGKPPLSVSAEFGEVTDPIYFHDVEQSIQWEMDFGEGVIANCECSYAEDKNFLKGEAENGSWELQPAYAYEGKKGSTSEGPMDLPNIYEQVRQMDHQALSFLNNEDSKVPGEMGLRDVKILMAIYESARNDGKKVELDLG